MTKRNPKSVKKPGDVFGFLTLIEHMKGGEWRCRCSCGKYATVKTGNLKASEERRLVNAFLDNPQANWEALRDYFQKSEDFFKDRRGRQYSPSGLVYIESDMYTYVYIGHKSRSLGTQPGEYGLLRWQADELFSAILSCAPGYVGFEEKLKAKMEREGYVTTKP